MQMSLFKREPETLEGYTPKFSREETLLGYKFERYQARGLGLYHDEGEEPKWHERHTITVLGKEISGPGPYTQDRYEIAVDIANNFLAHPQNEKRMPEVWAYLKENARELSNSKRYWKSWEHLQEIKKAKAEAAAIMRRVERALVIASVNALQTKAERSFSLQERQILLAEFNGGEFKENGDE